MSKTTKPLPKSAVKQADTPYLAQEDLDERQESLRKAAAAAAGVAAFKRPSTGSDG
jgi:hypothetical protein